MKTAVVIADGISQIMLMPEDKTEETLLKLITTDKDISVEPVKGKFYYGTSPDAAKGYIVKKNGNGSLYAEEDEKSIMLVLKPRDCSMEGKMGIYAAVLEQRVSQLIRVINIALSNDNIEESLEEEVKDILTSLQNY